MTDYLDNLIGIERVAYFQAPEADKVKPYAVTKGIELVELLLGGKIFFNVDGEIKPCGKGTIFWHIEGDYTLSDTDRNDPYRCQVFAFAVKVRRRPVPRVTRWEDPEGLDKFAAEAVSCFHNREFDRGVMGKYFYSRLYWQAYKSLRHPATAEYPHALCKAVKYLEGYLESNLTVDDVAVQAGVSKPYLFALFRKYLQCAPHQYLTASRLNRAKTLLAGSGRSIKEIAAHCGFESLECFYRSFKKHAGITPAAYREKYSPYSRVLDD
ncbi:MAG: AraC family transcriptional regulator [Victivallaceae bacterium]|nr:AraC family transcriptional regulator [Victivallaceae bacterium]